ncbi:MAG: DUF4982 domain-containing protein [Ruminococcus flavefaciens]|nr:DUF4982 domain-containing protein [Ruminococcus flavefaciens]
MIIDFNKNWIFCKEGENGKSVDLPHDAMLEEKRTPVCPNGKNSGYFPGGKYLYSKRFNIDENDLNKEITLIFEAVYRNCKVRVNGNVAAEHKYGYTEFTVNITPFVSSGDNLVEIIVDNSLEPNCRWYSGSGIYRNVWLEIKEKIHPNFIKVKTISYNPAVIEVQTDGESVIILDADGNTVASGKSGEFTVENAKLWSDETPYLYKAVATLGNETIETAFGIRKVEWSAKTGLLVNGKETLLRGGCIHQDNGVLGACTYADAEERRIRILKEAGYNAIRCAHNPAPRAMLDACDKLGMYVMDEAFDGWYIPKTYHDYARVFDSEWQGDITAMVEKDFNHPCVIMYSVGNEVSETATEKGVETCGKLADFVRSLDSTRPVTAGINVLLNVYSSMGIGVYKQKGEYKAEPVTKNKKYKEKKTGSAFFNAMAQKLGALMFFMSKGRKGDRATRGAAEKLDIIGLNYAASRYEPDVKKYPERMMVGSETMVSDLPYNWEQVKKHKAIVGDFTWAAWDYLGEACVGDWTYHSYKGLPLLAGSGTVDITGKIGAEAYYEQIIWGLRKKPFIGVRPMNHAKETATKSAWRITDCIASWNWQPYNGKKALVEVYAQGYKVKLYLNDIFIGKKKLKKYKALFKVKYSTGTLTAVVCDKDGKVLARQSISSGKGVGLKAVPEKAMLKAGSDELCYLPIEFCDDKGNIVPYAENNVTVMTDGLTLLGLGSSLCKTNETYLDNEHTSHRGRVLAILKAGEKKGTAKIYISAKGYMPITVDIEVV